MISCPGEGSPEKAEDQLSLGRHRGCCLLGLLEAHQDDGQGNCPNPQLRLL